MAQVPNIGEAFRAIRKQCAYSQRTMATALGVSPVHLCNIERGHSLPSLELITVFENATGKNPYVVAWKAGRS